MGLVSQILPLPLAPVRGTGWVVDQVLQAAEDEYYDPAPVRAELRALERELLEGLEWLEEQQRQLRGPT